MTKLYRVVAEHEYIIAVEDDEDVFQVADEEFNNVRYDMDMTNTDIVVCEVIENVDMVKNASGWDPECIPYGRDGNKRIKEILEENQ